MIAIIVPILLDISQSNQTGTVVSPIPEKPNSFIVKRLSLDEPQQTTLFDDRFKSIEQSEVPNSSKVVESQKQLEVLKVELEPKLPEIVTEIKKSLKKPQAWVVQIASFSKENNAVALRNKLQKSGYRAFIERVSESKKIRVKVGPELSKNTAENLQTNLMEEFQLQGVVIKHRAGTSVVTAGG